MIYVNFTSRLPLTLFQPIFHRYLLINRALNQIVRTFLYFKVPNDDNFKSHLMERCTDKYAYIECVPLIHMHNQLFKKTSKIPCC